MRYIKWDYYERIATEYTRLGECGGCGDCCKAMIRFTTNEKHTRDGAEGTDEHGVWAEVDDGEKRRYFGVYLIEPGQIICQKLKGNQCLAHNQKDLICSGYPFIPEHIYPFPECTYSFERVQEWVF